jgi:urease accessory protein
MDILFLAHTGLHTTADFAHGFTHPLFGLDHLLAMIAVGLWAVQLGGRALWAVPASFVGVMALGGALGMAGVPLPLIEPGIMGSVLLFGLLVTFAVKMPLWASAAVVGLFALFHGHAHGAEMGADTNGLLYALGFMLGTALLHAAGLATGLIIQGKARDYVLRAGGAVIAVWGIVIIVQSVMESGAA